MRHSRKDIRRARVLLALAVVVAAAGIGWIVYSVPPGTWQPWVESIPPVALLAALTALPILGFPVSVLHVATGARFGMTLGLLAVALSTGVHLLSAHVLARRLDRPLRRLLARLGWRLPTIPKGMSWTFSLWFALVPGLSYAVKNLAAPLTSVPLHVYLATTWPVHVARSLIALGVGQSLMAFSWPRLGLVAIYAVALALLTRTLARRLRVPTHD